MPPAARALATAPLITTLMITALLITAPLIAAESSPERIYIRAGTLIDGTDAAPRRDVALVIQGERIVSVGPWGAAAPPAGATVVDLSQATVLPGLIDAHVHLSMTIGPGWESEPVRRDLADVAIEATVNAARTLRAGFTTVRNVGDFGGETVALREAIDSGRIEGPQVQTARSMLSMTGGHGDWTNAFSTGVRIEAPGPDSSGVCDSPDACRLAVRLQVKSGADVIKVSATGGVLSKGDDIGARQFTDAELAAIVGEAHALGRKVAAHGHGADGIKAAVRAGVDSIEHGSILDDEAIRLMKERGTWLVPTLLAGETVEARAKSGGVPAWAAAKALAVRPRMTDSFGRAVKAGVRIAFGTDSGVSAHGDNAREFALMVRAGMTPAAAVRAATRDAAALLGVGGDRGTLEAGKRADFIAVGGDPLADVGLLTRPQAVWKNGRAVRLEPAAAPSATSPDAAR